MYVTVQKIYNNVTNCHQGRSAAAIAASIEHALGTRDAHQAATASRPSGSWQSRSGSARSPSPRPIVCSDLAAWPQATAVAARRFPGRTAAHAIARAEPCVRRPDRSRHRQPRPGVSSPLGPALGLNAGRPSLRRTAAICPRSSRSPQPSSLPTGSAAARRCHQREPRRDRASAARTHARRRPRGGRGSDVPRAPRSARLARSHTAPFGVDDDGPRPESLERALGAASAGGRLSSRAQNPTGAAISERRAADLCRVSSTTSRGVADRERSMRRQCRALPS